MSDGQCWNQENGIHWMEKDGLRTRHSSAFGKRIRAICSDRSSWPQSSFRPAHWVGDTGGRWNSKGSSRRNGRAPCDGQTSLILTSCCSVSPVPVHRSSASGRAFTAPPTAEAPVRTGGHISSGRNSTEGITRERRLYVRHFCSRWFGDWWSGFDCDDLADPTFAGSFPASCAIGRSEREAVWRFYRRSIDVVH